MKFSGGVSVSSVGGRNVYPVGMSVDLTPPECVPLARLTAVQSAEVAQGVGAVLPPAHPGLLEPPPAPRLAGRPPRPRTDHPAIGQIARIVHAKHVAA